MKRKLVAAILAVAMVGTLSACGKKEDKQEALSSLLVVEEAGKATPEETIEAFVQAIADNDLQTAISLTAIQSQANNYNLQAQVDRYNSYSYSSLLNLPSDYEQYRLSNTIALLNQFFNQLNRFSMGFLLTEAEMDKWVMRSSVEGDDLRELESIVAKINPSGLAGLAVEEMITPLSHTIVDDAFLATWIQQLAVYGADEMTERVVLYSHNRRLYVGGFRLFRYGDEWKIMSLASVMAGQSTENIIVRVDMDEWEAYGENIFAHIQP